VADDAGVAVGDVSQTTLRNWVVACKLKMI